MPVTIRTPELENEVINRLEAGETLRGICQSPEMPAASTVCLWVNESPLFAERYARARNMGLDAIADSTIAIADDLTEDANSRRVRVDARKWLLSKLRPDKYGDRTIIAGDANAPLAVMTVADTLRLRRQERLKELTAAPEEIEES